MPGCILRVSDEDFDVDAFLEESSLRPYRIHRRGEIRPRAGKYIDSGMCVNVSEVDSDLAAQIADAIRFLQQNDNELRRLRNFPGISDIRLDFGVFRRDVMGQFDFFPSELLRLAGNLGVGIEFSQYAASPKE